LYRLSAAVVLSGEGAAFGDSRRRSFPLVARRSMVA
jgi:hypothetical protein